MVTLAEARKPNRLILCFDGTGNKFSGSNADTNVVKMLNKLDCSSPSQQHYYQTGIGKSFCTLPRGNNVFQMSDIPLAWMIREVELAGQQDPAAAVAWSNNVDEFKRRFAKGKDQALRGFMHDSLRFGYGTASFKVLLWWLLEWCPLITRWELKGSRWEYTRFPLNKGGTRDIPLDADLHESLVWRLETYNSYNPRNNHGDNQAPCLKHDGRVAEVKLKHQSDPDHNIFTLRNRSAANGAGINGESEA